MQDRFLNLNVKIMNLFYSYSLVKLLYFQLGFLQKKLSIKLIVLYIIIFEVKTI